MDMRRYPRSNSARCPFARTDNPSHCHALTVDRLGRSSDSSCQQEESNQCSIQRIPRLGDTGIRPRLGVYAPAATTGEAPHFGWSNPSWAVIQPGLIVPRQDGVHVFFWQVKGLLIICLHSFMVLGNILPKGVKCKADGVRVALSHVTNKDVPFWKVSLGTSLSSTDGYPRSWRSPAPFPFRFCRPLPHQGCHDVRLQYR